MEYIYGISFQQVLLSIIIGIVLSTIIYEKKGILSGGIITPAIISLFMSKIIFVLITICMVILLHIIINKLRNHVILFGRRLYSITLLIGIGMVLATNVIMSSLHKFCYGMYVGADIIEIVLPYISFTLPKILYDLGLGTHYYGYVIGLLIIPIIVNDTQVQGLSKTVIALLSISSITYIIVTSIS